MDIDLHCSCGTSLSIQEGRSSDVDTLIHSFHNLHPHDAGRAQLGVLAPMGVHHVDANPQHGDAPTDQVPRLPIDVAKVVDARVEAVREQREQIIDTRSERVTREGGDAVEVARARLRKRVTH